MILGIETSVEHVAVAIGDHRGVRGQVSIASDRRHAESLTPMISFLMDQVGATMSEVSAVAVDVGPGLFTGMRVGIATAQMIAWALDVPVLPVCSLDALAMNATWSDVPVVAALDARRGEMYWAIYRVRADGAEPQRITEPAVSSPQDVAVELADRGEPLCCVGTGFLAHQGSFDDAPWCVPARPDLAHPTADNVVRLGGHLLARDETTTAANVAPMYLRPPDAEIKWNVRESSR